MFVAPKYQPIEILIPLNFTGFQIRFTDQPSLRNKKIVGLEIYPFEVMPYSPLTQSGTIATVDIKLLTFEFFEGNIQTVNKIPSIKLNRIQPNAVSAFSNDVFVVNNWQLTWDKCNMYVANSGSLSATNKVVTIGVYYYD